MSDQIKLLLYIKNMLSDLIYLNGVIATEVIKITESSAAQRFGEDFLKESNCVDEHKKINDNIVTLLNKYNKTSEEIERVKNLQNHILKHD